MSSLKAPHKVLEELEKLRRRFIWGGTDEKRKLKWVDWSKVVADKKRWWPWRGYIKGAKYSFSNKMVVET